ncbi:SCO0930 family lipoprotein [Streptomyces sp. NPDC097619]|uniref:SCO0930 family lipoprotein n=1 Tax=Streptomyces sp. NPDC097619 TaxID=3157228 RepID=UPI0033313889
MKKRIRLSAATALVSALLLSTGCGNDGGGEKTLVQPAAGSVDGDAGQAGRDGSGAGGDDAAGDAAYGSGGYGDEKSGSANGNSDEAGGNESGTGGNQVGKSAGRLNVRDIAGIGPSVTDSRGFTLYLFDKDTTDPAASTCAGECARTWPPVPADDATAGAVVDPRQLGEVPRADGTRQLTLGGRPVYRYRLDTAPGQAKGEGVGGTWHAIGPDGRAAARDGAGRTPEPSPPPAAPATPPAAPPVALATRQDPELGRILVDGRGHTLYRFDKDSAWPMRTACTGACADQWKPVPPMGRAGVRGVDPDLVNSFTRPDGTRQLAVDCWLLYTYVGDTRPGEVNGQGKGGTWWAVAPDGKKAGAPRTG